MTTSRRLEKPVAVQIEVDHRRARVIDMAAYRIRLDAADRDSILNAMWNEMSRLTQEAWSWRDPESIEALEFQLANLKAHAFDDWRK
jgi:hypothetical protein